MIVGFFICSGVLHLRLAAPCANAVQFFCDPEAKLCKWQACIVLRDVCISDSKPLPAVVAVPVDPAHFASNANAIKPTKIPSIKHT